MHLLSWRMSITFLLAASACDSGGAETYEPPGNGEPAPGADEPADVDEDLGLGPVAPGFVRYRTPVITTEPGESTEWMQWIAGPLDAEYDVVAITGNQSQGGHHALVYATAEVQEPGFTRPLLIDDQFTTRLLGGVGGEGGASVELPEGVVFRVAKGSYLVVQTHYINYTPEPLEGRSVIDIHLAPADDGKRLAALFASVEPTLDLPPGQESTLEVSCEIKDDLQLLSIANHMHNYGARVLTEYIAPDGSVTELKRDDRWSPEWALNPNFTTYSIESPLVLRAGGRLRTTCAWDNDTDDTLDFPTEMCVFFGFILNDNDISCLSGRWVESQVGTVTLGTGQGPAPAGSCANADDRAIVEDAAFEAHMTTCGTGCGLSVDVEGCAAACLVTEASLSDNCATCHAQSIACTIGHCLRECVGDTASSECRECSAAHCESAYLQCKGF